MKHDKDRMLETLESFRDSVPAHVRLLLRLLAARCDELERRLALIEGELFLAAPDHRQTLARQVSMAA
jgi:hypothetical protein